MINPKYLLISCLLLFVVSACASLAYAEKLMKAEGPVRKNRPNKLSSDILDIFYPISTKVTIAGYVIAAIVGVYPIFIICLKEFGNIEKSLFVFLLITFFASILILFTIKIHNKTYNKIILYKNGISVLNRITNKRIAINFSDIQSAIYDDFFNEIQINGTGTEAEALIQLPIRNIDKLSKLISRHAGEKNALSISFKLQCLTK